MRSSEIQQLRFEEAPITPVLILPGTILKLAAPWELHCRYGPYNLANALGVRGRDWQTRSRKIDLFKVTNPNGSIYYRFVIPANSVLLLASIWSRYRYNNIQFRIYSTNWQPIEFGPPDNPIREVIRRKLKPSFVIDYSDIEGVSFYRQERRP